MGEGRGLGRAMFPPPLSLLQAEHSACAEQSQEMIRAGNVPLVLQLNFQQGMLGEGVFPRSF